MKIIRGLREHGTAGRRRPATGTPGPTSKQDMPVRARTVLRVRPLWIFPIVVPVILVALMSLIYIGSVVNPTAHLHGLPVEVVDEDVAINQSGQPVDFGSMVVHGLTHTEGIDSRLQFSVTSLARAKKVMDRGGAFATVVIPPAFTAALLQLAGASGIPAGTPPAASIQLLENSRLGSLGVNLAAGYLTPAVTRISTAIGSRLVAVSAAASRANPVVVGQLADPVTLRLTPYRPLPPASALGLSAMYVSLIAIMAGFVGATIVNSSVDGALGYATSDIGPRWRQRRPVPISRRRTLFTKWAVVTVLVPILAAVLLLVAVGGLGMYAPHVLSLWLLFCLAGLMVAFGTLALLAAFGSIGQLLAMLVLVYLSLASSGGTVPLQALPGFFKWVGQVEPLRQVLGGARSILYFNAQADAGLTHSVTVLAIELVCWSLVGLAVTSWYDHKKLYRISPEIIGFVSRTISQRVAQVTAGTPDSVGPVGLAGPVGPVGPAETSSRAPLHGGPVHANVPRT
jgi:YhgE/Pip-like protein